jgi:hypothetical protein
MDMVEETKITEEIIEEELDEIVKIEKPIGKIRKRTDKLCPDCEDGYLYVVVYDEERESVIYSKEFYECFECEYKEEKKNKNNNHRKEINLDEIYQ